MLIWDFDTFVIRISRDLRVCLGEWILASIDARFSGNRTCERALIQFLDVRSWYHIDLLLLLLLSRIIKIVASKDVIIINSMV